MSNRAQPCAALRYRVFFHVVLAIVSAQSGAFMSTKIPERGWGGVVSNINTITEGKHGIYIYIFVAYLVLGLCSLSTKKTKKIRGRKKQEQNGPFIEVSTVCSALPW